MKALTFTKMSGCGNDFMVIDNRQHQLPVAEMPDLVVAACRRRMAVGADGIIFIDTCPSEIADFQWHFFNSDGSRAEMCGNGARCAARYAMLNGIAGPHMRFQTDAGIIEAQVEGDLVQIRLTDPEDFKPRITVDSDQITYTGGFINTGVPHLVIQMDSVKDLEMVSLARPLRYHPQFAPAGTNVNFVELQGAGRIRLRTYERGVEDETLACGTGAVAAALVTAHTHGWEAPVMVQVQSGGTLTIGFVSTDNGFERISLAGDARLIYQAELNPEALL